MDRLLIIADDFTGALDTAVQFTNVGAVSRVSMDIHDNHLFHDDSFQVLALDAETRHLSAEDAYRVVYRIAKTALQAGFTHIYKKTDSALRGNIGSELKALMDVSNKHIVPFFPAYPKMNRITIGGIHYINGVPVSEAALGNDPFDPVEVSSVPGILYSKTNAPVILHTLSHDPSLNATQPGIHIYDAESDEDLYRAASVLGSDDLVISAGCAGFAAILADIFAIREQETVSLAMDPSLFVVCGSINPVTIQQMCYAKQQGFPMICLTPAQKLEPSWLESAECGELVDSCIETLAETKRLILTVNENGDLSETQKYAEEAGIHGPLRIIIAEQMGSLIQKLFDHGLKATIACTGGDTLRAILEAIGVTELQPLREVFPGTVLTRCIYRGKAIHIISKSGGFGESDLFLRLAEMVAKQKKEV